MRRCALRVQVRQRCALGCQRTRGRITSEPPNLFFLTRGADGAQTIKVLDFGISKTLDEQQDGDGMQLTRTTSLLGSPLYMSPEQLRSAREVTVQSDIWSLGAILYQLLVGEVPFNTRTFSELIMMVNMQQPPPIMGDQFR